MSVDESNLNFDKPVEEFYLSTFKMRCPECFKSYTVDWADIQEAEPRFKCNDCSTTFSIDVTKAFSEKKELIGYKVEDVSPELNNHNITPKAELFNCPKCTQPYAAGDTECKKCGVIFLKIAERELERRTRQDDMTGMVVSDELKDAWERVLLQYESEELHNQFVQLAWKESSLDYAAKKYSSILEAVPRDEMADKFSKRIVGLVNLRFELNEAQSFSPIRRWFNRQEIAEIAKSNIHRLKITNVIMFFCGVLILIGMANPALRNLIGFGAAVLTFILALRFYFRVI